MTEINTILNQFRQNIFDPAKDSANKLPDAQGNYLVCLKKGSHFHFAAIHLLPRFVCFDDFAVIYTGIASKSLRNRDYKSHFRDNAGRSTLRKSLGVLFGYQQIPRDKNPASTKTKFNSVDEARLTDWMKTNLLMFYCVNPDCKEDEIKLINHFKPPLNLQNKLNDENSEYRKLLKQLRAEK